MGSKVSPFFCIPAGENISANSYCREVKGVPASKANWFRRLRGKAHTNEERKGLGKGLDAFLCALREDLGDEAVKRVKAKDLADLFDASGRTNGNPLESTRARTIALKAFAEANKAIEFDQPEKKKNNAARNSCNLGATEKKAEKLSFIAKSTGSEDVKTVCKESASYLVKFKYDEVRKSICKSQMDSIHGELLGIIRNLLSKSACSPGTKQEQRLVSQYYKAAKVLPFKEIAKHKCFMEPDDQRVITVRSQTEIVLTVQPNISKYKKITEEMRNENRIAHTLLKAYVAYHYGPEVAFELWAPGSELVNLLRHGAALTQNKIKSVLEQAVCIRLQIPFAITRWRHGEVPAKRPDSWYERKATQKNHDFFEGERAAWVTWSLVRVVAPGVDVSEVSDAQLAERIENKATILAFLDYLESCEIEGSICAFMWKMHLHQMFREGRCLTRATVCKLYNKAKAFQRVQILQVSEESADEAFHRRIQSGTIDAKNFNPISEYANLWFGKMRLAEEVTVPANVVESEANRRYLLDVAQYVFAFWGKDAAEAVWKLELRDSYMMGIRISPDKVLVLLQKIQSKSLNKLSIGEQAIEKYANDMLRNSSANREERGLSAEEMRQLYTNFKIAAYNILWSRGSAPSGEEMDHIASNCFMSILCGQESQSSSSSDIATNSLQGEFSENEVVDGDSHEIEMGPAAKEVKGVKERLQKANPSAYGPARTVDRLSDWLKEVESDSLAPWVGRGENAANIITIVRNVGNFAKYIWVIDRIEPDRSWHVRFKKWVDYYQITILTDEERNKFFSDNPHVITSDPQAIGVFGSLIGILLEYRALTVALKENAKREHSIEILRMHFRATVKLKYVVEYMIDNYHQISLKLPPDMELPPKDYLNKFWAEIDTELTRVSYQLKAKLPSDYDPYVDNSYKWRHPYGMFVNVAGAAAGATFTAGSCPNWFGFDLWDRDVDCLIAGNIMLDGLGFPSFFINAYNADREATLFLRANAAEWRAFSILGMEFQKLKDAHKEKIESAKAKRRLARERRKLRKAPQGEVQKAEKQFRGDILKVQQLQLKLPSAQFVTRPVEKFSIVNAGHIEYLKALRPEDKIFHTHLAYRHAKAKTKRFLGKSNKVTPRRLITNDIRVDISKSIVHQAKTGLHAANFGLRGISTISSVWCMASTAAMFGAEGGMLGGSTVGPWGTVVGTLLGGIGAAVCGFFTGIATCVINYVRNHKVASKNKERIQGWFDAFVHHEGPKWKLMMDGLNNETGLSEERKIRLAEKLAFRKLVRCDIDLALSIIVDRLQKERYILGESQTITNMLKRYFCPHREEFEDSKDETESGSDKSRKTFVRDESKAIQNKHWRAFVDRLAEMADEKLIHSQLKNALVAPQNAELQLNNFLSPR